MEEVFVCVFRILQFADMMKGANTGFDSVDTHTVGSRPRLMSGAPMGLGVPYPSVALVPDFAYRRQGVDKYMASSRACKMFGRCLPSPRQGYAVPTMQGYRRITSGLPQALGRAPSLVCLERKWATFSRIVPSVCQVGPTV